MRTFIFLSVFLSVFSLKAQQWSWASQSSTIGSDQWVKALKTDPQDNAYVILSQEAPCVYNNFNMDAGTYVLKFDPNGQLLWVHKIGGSSFSLAVNSFGQVVVAGNFEGATTIENQTVNSTGDLNCYLLELSTNGDLLSLQIMNNAGDQSIGALLYDQSNNLYINGEYSTQMVIDNQTLLCDSAYRYGFIYKRSTAGTNNFITKYWMPDPVWYNLLKIDDQQNVYLSGTTESYISIPGTKCGWPGTWGHGFMLKLDSFGTPKWLGSTGETYYIYNFFIDDHQNLFLKVNTGSHYTYSQGLFKYDSEFKNRKTIGWLGYGYGDHSISPYDMQSDFMNVVLQVNCNYGEPMPCDGVTIDSVTYPVNGEMDFMIGKMDTMMNISNVLPLDAPGGEWLQASAKTSNGYLFAGQFENSPINSHDTLVFGNTTLTDKGPWRHFFLLRMIESPTNTEKQTVTNNFKVYPNPVNNNLIIDLPESYLQSEIMVMIYDLNGREIYSQKLIRKNQIDCSSLVAGVYLISIRSEDKAPIIGKFVKE
jgi:hypothetical protein